MPTSHTETEKEFAARALAVLDEAYGYYAEPPKQRCAEDDFDQDTYFEYVKAA